MSMSIAKTHYLSFQEACKKIPGRPHLNTIRRWADRGFEGIILQSWRVGNRRVTSIEAIDAFMAATTALRSSGVAVGTSTAHQAAEAQLDALGVS